MTTVSLLKRNNHSARVLRRCDSLIPYAKALLIVTFLLTVWISLRA
jgi:hypothetical protein